MNHEQSISMLSKLLAKGDDHNAMLTFLAIVDHGRKDLTEQHKDALRALLDSEPNRPFLQFLDVLCSGRGVFGPSDLAAVHRRVEALAAQGEANACVFMAMRHIHDQKNALTAEKTRDCDRLESHVKNKVPMAKELRTILGDNLVVDVLLSDRPTLSVQNSVQKREAANKSLGDLLRKHEAAVAELVKRFA